MKVSFAEDAIIHEIEGIDNLSAEEIEKIWFTKNDYREISYRDAVIIISIVRKTVQEDDCIRGLEGRTSVASDGKKQKFVEVMYTVLDEQERQLASGISDPITMASLYRKSTRACAKAAKKQGRRDWQSINESEMVSTEEEEEAPFTLPGSVTLVDEEATTPKKKPGSKNRIQRFLGRASSVGRGLGLDQNRI
jgi:hypothetical protein